MQGFTLVEMFLVIAIIGILAFVASPKITAVNSGRLEGAAHKLMTDCLYARQLSIANVAGATYACRRNTITSYLIYNTTNGQVIANPWTGGNFLVDLTQEYKGVSLPDTFTVFFDSSGAPNAAASIPLSNGSTTKTLSVNAAGVMALQ